MRNLFGERLIFFNDIDVVCRKEEVIARLEREKREVSARKKIYWSNLRCF